MENTFILTDLVLNRVNIYVFIYKYVYMHLYEH